MRRWPRREVASHWLSQTAGDGGTCISAPTSGVFMYTHKGFPRNGDHILQIYGNFLQINFSASSYHGLSVTHISRSDPAEPACCEQPCLGSREHPVWGKMKEEAGTEATAGWCFDCKVLRQCCCTPRKIPGFCLGQSYLMSGLESGCVSHNTSDHSMRKWFLLVN